MHNVYTVIHNYILLRLLRTNWTSLTKNSDVQSWCTGTKSDQQFEKQTDVLYGSHNEKHIMAL